MQTQTHHKEQQQKGSQKDIFFVWMVLMTIAVIGSNFLLEVGTGSPTGMVVASLGEEIQLNILLGSIMILLIAVLIGIISYKFATKKNKE
jgi:hypothetical protein